MKGYWSSCDRAVGGTADENAQEPLIWKSFLIEDGQYSRLYAEHFKSSALLHLSLWGQPVTEPGALLAGRRGCPQGRFSETGCNYICGVGLGEVQEAGSVGVGACRRVG